MSQKVAANKQVVEQVQKETGWTVSESRQAVRSTFDAISKLLKKNDRVSVTGVGSFNKTVKPAQRGGKKAINPFTKEPYITKSKPKQTKVKFRPGKSFKDRL